MIIEVLEIIRKVLSVFLPGAINSHIGFYNNILMYVVLVLALVFPVILFIKLLKYLARGGTK